MNQNESSLLIDLPPAFLRSKYMSLRTYRRDGTPIDCPVWFAWSGDAARVWFRSRADVAKLRRIARHPQVELRPCSWRGVVRADGPVLAGLARVLDPVTDGAVMAEAELALHRRYGWQWYSLHLFRLPFTHTVKVEMTLREKLATIRAQRPIEDSRLVEIVIDGHSSRPDRRR